MWSLEFLDEVDADVGQECGPTSTHTRGLVQFAEETCLRYLIAWHHDNPGERSMWCYELADDWDDPESPRSVACLMYGLMDDGKTAFSVVDAGNDFVRRYFPNHTCLARNQIMGTEMAKELFQITDFIWENDDRIAPIREWTDEVNGGAGDSP